MTALEELMRQILDYAGMFPPARLDLESALASYRAYREHPRAAFLGRFLAPCSSLEQAAEAIEGDPVPVTAILRCAAWSVREAPAELERAAASLAAFEARCGSPAVVELDLPAEAWESAGLRRAFVKEARKRFDPRAVWVEVNWWRDFRPAMDDAREGGASGVKLRTGGLTPETVPPPEVVAGFLRVAADAGLAIKFTAGLHSPVRCFDTCVGARAHGFLNVFAAGMLAFREHAAEETLAGVLERLDYADFRADGDHFHAGPHDFTTGEIAGMREKWLPGFGSCSFLEPVEHLEAHGLLSPP